MLANQVAALLASSSDGRIDFLLRGRSPPVVVSSANIYPRRRHVATRRRNFDVQLEKRLAGTLALNKSDSNVVDGSGFAPGRRRTATIARPLVDLREKLAGLRQLGMRGTPGSASAVAEEARGLVVSHLPAMRPRTTWHVFVNANDVPGNVKDGGTARYIAGAFRETSWQLVVHVSGHAGVVDEDVVNSDG